MSKKPKAASALIPNVVVNGNTQNQHARVMNEQSMQEQAVMGVQLMPEQVADDLQRGMRVMLTTKEAEGAVAQAYALRVWNGQSESLGRSVRIERVIAALDGQGLSTDGIELPKGGEDVDDWTKEDEEPLVWRAPLPPAEGAV
ncbi:MAG: hypothetical protein H7255_20740 [Ramlibacter sp.]|nr:hypothetical protein [Ramlibacter sp.]